MDNQLNLKGIRHHNLKDISVSIPHDALVVLTGISGSGKSSLAFDTIYAEGGRRYIETFSPYTRQFLDRLEAPDVDQVENIRPALALEQRNRISNSRSTVGSLTDINEYLKVVWSNLANIYCPHCNIEITADSAQSVVNQIGTLCSSKKFIGAICFSVPYQGSSSWESFKNTLIAEGFIRYYDFNDKQVKRIDAFDPEGSKQRIPKELLIVAERFTIDENLTKSDKQRLIQSCLQAFNYGHGTLSIIQIEGALDKQLFPLKFSKNFYCNSCERSYSRLKPAFFSYNSAIGACNTCNGFGYTLLIDPVKVVPDDSKTIAEGAIHCWTTIARSLEKRDLLRFCENENISPNIPWRKLTKHEQDLIFHSRKKSSGFRGVYEWFQRLERKTYKMHIRVLLARYRSQFECSDCLGSRLKSQALTHKIKDKNIADIWNTACDRLLVFFQDLRSDLETEDSVSLALDEIVSRLECMDNLGLSYLTLSRQTRTLSGGEFQRVNLASILGSKLVRTLLVLDEPSIGLHPKDTSKLLSVLAELRDRGNSLIVVEHEAEVIKSADYIIDLGPKAGSQGGEVVYQGNFSNLLNCKTSYTAQYFNQVQSKQDIQANPQAKYKFIKLQAANVHNLKQIDVMFPLQALSVVSGVSGSGKSTLIHQCLLPALEKVRQGHQANKLTNPTNHAVKSISGHNQVNASIVVDQSPIGASTRSNPATYTKAWDLIREGFADTADAQSAGLSKSAFSFNVDGGRCPTCKGAGSIKIEMQFLADVNVTCEDCNGARFRDNVLQIRYANKSILDFLKLTLDDAVNLFEQLDESKRCKDIVARLKPLTILGLGYLRLGQPLSTLSGGEAQRVKLASYLAEPDSNNILFILDEPTTGLHAFDIEKLLTAFRYLVDQGHSIICIEHNLDVIRSADWLVDLGPEGGVGGGYLLAQGIPAELVKNKKLMQKSYTLQYLTENKQSKKLAQIKSIHRPTEDPAIVIQGARHHNLRNVSVNLPQNKLSVITGVSGSGKSSFAFDILFSEGQRRYIDCLSPYARQFMKQLSRPDVDLVLNIPPTIAVSQKTAPPAGISTVATTSEIYQYLRLLYAKVGTQHCPEHKIPITSFSSELIAQQLVEKYQGERLFVFAPAIEGRKGHYHELFQRAARAEILEARIDGAIKNIDANTRLERHKIHWISLLVGSLKCSEANRTLLEQAIEQSLTLGNGTVEVAVATKGAAPLVYSSRRVCPKCKKGFRELDPQDFSFRSARGVCSSCSGRGAIGESKPKICPACNGARIGLIGRNVLIGGKNIHDLTKMSAADLLNFLSNLDLDTRIKPIIDPILKELVGKLKTIISIGLNYLSLDRESTSLSGGEAQRLRLARTLGSPLAGVCYVLDEPTIGLHPQDHAQLMNTLFELRDRGNTVVVVEHDEDTIRQADHIIDFGPGGGNLGGFVIAQGNPVELEANDKSITGQALRERSTNDLITLSNKKFSTAKRLTITKATKNNLKSIDASFLLNAFNVVIGVSGSGKSSLVHGTLIPALLADFEDSVEVQDLYWNKLKNADLIERFVEIDQAPVGRTPASTPASYLDILGDIRKIFALTPDAQARGWNPSYFSFNTKGGRCETCSGKGYTKIPMSFLPDAQSICEECQGKRFQESTLEITFKNFSIADMLNLTISEAKDLFAAHRKIYQTLSVSDELGVGYIKLGQPTFTLSGGEAQRMKIARELCSKQAKNTLYILDEPTTGLHMNDVGKLLQVLNKLIEIGNTIIVIEHNIDVIKQADHLIELGPGPAENGGELIFSGTPLELLESDINTPSKAFLKPTKQNNDIHHLSKGRVNE